jgi:Flp pilus assembly secretin CpaC
MRTIMKATMVLLALTSLAASAMADDVVQVTWRKAQVMSFGTGISGIIIGDPSVVDVTLDGNGQIIVFGKRPGETNMMITGSDNSVLFNAPIVVMPEDDRQVSIINAGSGTISERSWTCLTRCVQVIGPGGTSYASVTPAASAGSQLDKALASDAETRESLKQAAQNLQQSTAEQNRSISNGANAVGGAMGPGGGVMITP